jgi:DUF4097 and DUF4098 domain-containing protein YvlB
MTERLYEFEIGDQPRIELRLGSGDLHVAEGDPGMIRITLRGSDGTLQTIDVQQQGGTVSVVSRKKFGFLSGLDVGVTVPRGTAVHAKLASMDLVVDAPLDRLTGSVASGDVTAGEIESDVDLHSASGDIRIGRIGGNAKVIVASGDIRIDEIGGDATIKSGSGDIDVARVLGRCECKTASGDIVIEAFEGRSFQSSALAGDVVVGLPPGRTLDVSLQTSAGDVRNEFDVAGDDGMSGEATLDIKTLSGDIVLRSAS